jgi:hypothetical protein
MALFRSLIRIFSGQTVLDGLVLTNVTSEMDESHMQGEYGRKRAQIDQPHQ